MARALGITPTDIADLREGAPADLLFVVSGVYGGKPAPQLMEFAPRLHPETVGRAVLITSCTSGRNTQDAFRQALLARGIPVDAEEHVCPGSFLIFRLGRPNQADLRAAADFALKKVQDL